MITRAQIAALAPHAKDVYLAAFELAPSVLPQFEITTPLRIAHFVAQCMHETGGLTIVSESLNYSTPERLMAVWPRRFPTRESALPYLHNPAKLAEKVYGISDENPRGRMGNCDPGDGAKYIGRGLLQITGRGSYRQFSAAAGVDLEAQPELAVDARFALAVAAAEFRASGCNSFADADDVVRVTRAINGGLIGLDERRGWLVKVKAILGI